MPLCVFAADLTFQDFLADVGIANTYAERVSDFNNFKLYATTNSWHAHQKILLDELIWTKWLSDIFMDRFIELSTKPFQNIFLWHLFCLLNYYYYYNIVTEIISSPPPGDTCHRNGFRYGLMRDNLQLYIKQPLYTYQHVHQNWDTVICCVIDVWLPFRSRTFLYCWTWATMLNVCFWEAIDTSVV